MRTLENCDVAHWPGADIVGGADENTVRSLAESARDVPPPYRSFGSFVAALRAGEREALRLAYIWYLPLLRDQARRLGVDDLEREALAVTVLGDVLLHLQQADVPPRELVRYLVGALRNRARNAHRDRQRYVDAQEQAYAATGDGRERIIAECHSEYGMRTSSGHADESDAVSHSAIELLASFSAKRLTTEELEMMVGLSHHVPLRELALQAGISYGNARVKLHRLRERIPRLLRQHWNEFTDAQQTELRRFLRRAGVMLETSSGLPGSRLPSRRRDDATGEGSHDTE